MDFPPKIPLHHSHHLARFVVTVAGILVGGYIVLTLGFMFGRWNGALAEKVSAAIPTPVAWVGWHPIWSHDYVVFSRGLRHLTATHAAQYTATRPPSAEALSQLIRSEETKLLLASYQTKVTSADIDQAFTAQVAQSGSQSAVTTAIHDLYGWSLSDFRRYVTSADSARDVLRQKLSFDAKKNATQAKQAQTVDLLAKASVGHFAELAQMYSEDSYGAVGGDLGYISRGEQAQEIEDVAFSLAINQVSDVVHTKFGFHILKVTDRKQVNGEDQVRLAMIFIAAPNVDQEISAQLKKQHVSVWEHGLKWDAKAAAVTGQ